MANKNVLKAIADMQQHLNDLNDLDVNGREKRIRIRKDAVTCSNLMDYSYEVADTYSKEWKLLDSLVTQVLRSTSDINYSEWKDL